MKNYGDVTKINGAQVPKVDVITFGAPCQDLSIAGKRAGMKSALMGDEETTRSGLFFEAIRIIKEMREDDKRNGRTDVNIRPRFAVYENVPGAFSSNHGEDFRAVLEETAKVAKRDACIPGPPGGKWPSAGCIMGDGWSIAWRVHDAQFWGVPQRRKRISLVADFGGATAPEILFERKGLSGDITESEKEGKDAATDVRSGIEETSRAVSFQERAGKPGGGKGILIQNERTGALSTLNNQSVVYGISAYDSNSMKSGNPNSGIYEAETARTLDLNGGSPACNQGGMAVVQGADMYNGSLTGDIVATLNAASGNSPTHSGPSVVCLEGNGSRPSHRGDGYSESETMYTLNSTEHHAVAVENHPADSRVKISEDGKVQTLSGRMGTGGGNVPMVLEPTVFSRVAAARCAQDGRGAVHTQMMSDPESNFVLEPVTASKASHFTHGIEGDIADTLYATDYKEAQLVSYGIDRAAYNQGMNAQYDFSIEKEKIATQVAKGPGAVASFYPQMKAESQCYRDDDVSNTLVNGTNPGFQNGIVTAVDCRNGTENPNINGTLQSKEQGYNTNSNNIVRIYAIVRRLTPLECERLQGFPDYWTDIGDWVDSKDKKHKGDSDSPRYKALGNSIALPFWEWMAMRMVRFLKNEEPTMASLFDGIGGFPLSFSRAGVKPVWCSEIEEFPIAVTKLRFPD